MSDQQANDSNKVKHGTVEFLLRRMKHKGDLPAFSQHIIEINKKLSSLRAINFSSAGELSKVILNDMSLTNKLLRVVNSAFYGNLSGRVSTISRAVFLLGFDKVRMAAASLMIFEHLQNKSQSSDLKDAALSSFFSAVIAKDVAENMMIGNSEEFFICAMLHNLGKHLVICYFPEEYSAIKNMVVVQGINEQTASKTVLGVSYSELGMGITKSWNFPEKIIDSMDIINEPETKASETENDVLKTIANYANELCAVTATPDDEKRQEALQALSDKYKVNIALPVNRTITLLEGAASKIDRYVEMIKIDKTQSPLMRRLVTYRVEKASPQTKSPLRIMDAGGEESAVSKKPSTPALSDAQTEILKGCIAEINEALRADNTLSDMIYMILEAMYRGFEFNRILFCMLDQTRTKMVARFGFGENIDEIIGKFQLKVVRSSDIFNVAILRMKDFLIDDLMAAGIRENLPDWYVKNISATSMLIYPLVVRDKCIGIFYADKKTPVILNQEQIDFMNILRSKANWAILNKH